MGTVHVRLVPGCSPRAEPPPPFEFAIRVAPGDIDELGHASNISYVRWVQEAAIAHSTASGYGLGYYLECGAIFVIVRHEIDYVRPAFVGDGLVARTWIESAQAAKCLRVTELLRGSEKLACARTTWGFVETKTGRPKRVPDALRKALF